MKKLTKLICIVALLFSVPTCFAGEKEKAAELAALKSDILDPIIDPITGNPPTVDNPPAASSSYSRLLSLKMIEIQKARRKKITDKHDMELVEKTAEEAIRADIGAARFQEIQKGYAACSKFYEDIARGSQEAFARYLAEAWIYKNTPCYFYTYMTLTAFMFNHKNSLVPGNGKPWLFKQIVTVMTTPETGDHRLVLVEGKSGTVFVIDPWFPKIEELNGVTKLSEIPYYPSNNAYYPNSEALNNLFGDSDSGITYFDEKYVNEKTKWVVLWQDVRLFDKWFNEDFGTNVDISKSLKENKKITVHMEDIYNAFRYDFPAWQADYKDLYPKSGVAKTELEHKNHPEKEDKPAAKDKDKS